VGIVRLEALLITIDGWPITITRRHQPALLMDIYWPTHKHTHKHTHRETNVSTLQFTQFESDMVVDSAKRISGANEPKIVHVDDDDEVAG